MSSTQPDPNAESQVDPKAVVAGFLKEARNKQADETGWGLTEDGWDWDALEKVGVSEAFDKANRIEYELRNARRGSYADFGTTIEELRMALENLSEEFKYVSEALEDR